MEPHTHVRFGPFELTSADGRLRRDGEPVPLQELPFRLLLALIRAPGTVVSREELCRALWGETVVEYESGLNTAARKLRDALGDDSTQPTYIETVPKRGYRLRVPVEHVETLGVPAQRSNPLEVGRRPPLLSGLSRWLSAGAALVILELALFSAFSGETVAARLIVLPVEGARTELGIARASGLTDQFIAHLARLDPGRLVVLGPATSRSVDSRSASARQLARDLGVTHLLAARLSDEPAPRIMRAADRHRLDSSNLPRERYQRAVAALASGDAAHAVEVLAQLAGDRPPWFVFLPVDPGFDAVRGSAVFRRLLRLSVLPTHSFGPISLRRHSPLAVTF